MDKVTEETREVEVERSPETQESEEPDEDLNAVFLKGEKLRSRLDDLESTSKEYASVWAEALATYEGLRKKVDTLALISPNEEVDDIATKDLKFLLVDYYLADLHQRAPGTGRERLSNLERAKHELSVFMQRCERVTLLKGDELKAWEDKTSVEEDEAPLVRPDPAKARAEKIERFKREKAAKDRLRELTYVLEKVMKEGGEEGEVEELERERVRIMIEACIRKAIDDVVMINQEMPILEMMARREPSKPEEPKADKAPPRPATNTPLTVTHVDSINGQLRMRKEEIRARVFQPGYSQPTMSLEEYADKEVQAAKEREERAKNAPKPPRRYDQLVADGDEDDETLVEEAAYRDRAWDDWKDEHPRGSGNKMGKIF